MSVTINGTTGIDTTGLTADTNTLYVDTTNDRVGVGTTSPSYKLSCIGDVVAGAGNNAGGGGGLISQGSVTTGALGANAIFLDNDGAGLGRWRSYGTNTSTYGAFVFQAATSNNTQAERMRIDSSGNVTIGGVGILGIGQSWSDVTASRALGTTYTNSTGKPIQVMMNYNGTSSTSRTLTAVVNGTTIMSVTTNYICPTLNFIVPSGATYSITSSGGVGLGLWSELR